MFKSRPIFKKINSGIRNVYLVSIQNFSSNKSVKTDKVLVVSKLSRYEFERRKHKNLDENYFVQFLQQRGTNVEQLIHYHKLHKEFEQNVVTTLTNMGVSVKTVNSEPMSDIGDKIPCELCAIDTINGIYQYVPKEDYDARIIEIDLSYRTTWTDKDIQEADLIMPIGGDGTFLLAAGKVTDNKTPVIGFNSDPNRSEGYLCLPKKYSTNIREAVEKIHAGHFEWLMRSRIRTTLIVSDNQQCFVPNYLHDMDGDSNQKFSPSLKNADVKVLPCLALNEVFMGETLSARVSHLRLRLNGSTDSTNLKCSGICVSTGTGSTSWHLSINRLPVQSVAELLRLIDIDATEGKDSLATVLSDIYNKNLIFNPDDKRMAYTIRELISAGVWPEPKGIKSRGFATKIEIKSNCFDASLVIDGGVSFSFNDGAMALLEIKPEDALRTVVLKN